MTLRSRLDIHPGTKILQPDTFFASGYEELEGFDEGTVSSGLEKRDSLSWKNKSWIWVFNRACTSVRMTVMTS